MTSIFKTAAVVGLTAVTLGASVAATTTSADARGFGRGGFHGGYGRGYA